MGFFTECGRTRQSVKSLEPYAAGRIVAGSFPEQLRHVAPSRSPKHVCEIEQRLDDRLGMADPGGLRAQGRAQ